MSYFNSLWLSYLLNSTSLLQSPYSFLRVHDLHFELLSVRDTRALLRHNFFLLGSHTQHNHLRISCCSAVSRAPNQPTLQCRHQDRFPVASKSSETHRRRYDSLRSSFVQLDTYTYLSNSHLVLPKYIGSLPRLCAIIGHYSRVIGSFSRVP